MDKNMALGAFCTFLVGAFLAATDSNAAGRLGWYLILASIVAIVGLSLIVVIIPYYWKKLMRRIRSWQS